MLTAAYLTASFMVAGVGAWYLLKGKHQQFARTTLGLGTAFAAVLIAGQVFIGDILYGTMLKHQPSKMQALRASGKNNRSRRRRIIGSSSQTRTISEIASNWESLTSEASG